MSEGEDPFETIRRQTRESHEHYKSEVLNTRPFQDGLRYLEGIASDLRHALVAVALAGARYSLKENYLLFRFAPYIVEPTLAITMNAKEGLQNAARRELRFLLEAVVKLSSCDFHPEVKTFEERLAGLNDCNQRFEDYVNRLSYFNEFEKPDEANNAILSLYSELSRYVHATVPQFEEAMARHERGEGPSQESVATLNRFNKLAFQVYDLVLVRLFHGLGPGPAGDTFVHGIDKDPNWRFHKAKFVARLSKCFDYKHERRVRRGAI